MDKLNQLKKEMFADDRLNAEEVARLRELLYEGEGMTKEKGDFLFDP